MTAATTSSCANTSACAAAASGIDASATARTASATIIMRRLRIRSARTPTASPKSGNGRNSTAPRMPICSGVACSVRMATLGSASALIAVPNTLHVWPPHSKRKSRPSTPATASSIIAAASARARSVRLAAVAPARGEGLTSHGRRPRRASAARRPARSRDRGTCARQRSPPRPRSRRLRPDGYAASPRSRRSRAR